MHQKRALVGIRLAQLAALLVVVEGFGDLFIEALLPYQEEVVGIALEKAEGLEQLVVTLLHTLGANLVAAGIAMLALLQQLLRTGDPRLAVFTGAIATLSQGSNALGLYSAGASFYLYPLVLMVVILSGLLFCALPTWGLRSPSFSRSTPNDFGL